MVIIMEIVKCDEEVLKKLPATFDLLYEKFQGGKIELYACKDRDCLSFMAMSLPNCFWIDKRGYREFKINEHYELLKYDGKEFEVMFLDGQYPNFVCKKNKMECTVGIVGLDDPDDEGYTGEVYFHQYNPENEVFCQLSYSHMYNEINGKAKIYCYHTNKPSAVYIETDSKKEHDREWGPVDPHISSFDRLYFERGQLGYTAIVMNEQGILNTLINGTYRLEREDSLRRFAKARWMWNGRYKDFWPFCRLYKAEELYKLVTDQGFRIDVPDEMLHVYNEEDYTVEAIKSALLELGDEKKREECVVRMVLHND